MNGPQIFISHSARGEPETQSLGECLRTGLTEAGFEVWFDEDSLEIGDEYRRRIGAGLATCDAGIVLLSAAGLEAEWVLMEAGILRFRDRDEPDFLLLPVIVGIDADELVKPPWNPLALRELQLLTHGDDAQTLGAILDRLQPLALRLDRESPAGRLHADLVDDLSKTGSEKRRYAAEELGVTSRGRERVWTKDLARRLLEAPIDSQYRALCQIATGDAEAAVKCFKKVAPYTWIAEAAGAQVRQAAGSPRGERALGLNAARVCTCEWHIHRADHTWTACPIEGGVSDDDIEELVRQARASLTRWYARGPMAPIPDATIDAEIAHSPVNLPFLVLPLEAAFREVLDAIREAWPHVPVLLRCAGDSLEPIASLRLPHVALLNPPIVPAEEERIMRQYDKHLSRLQRYGPSPA